MKYKEGDIVKLQPPENIFCKGSLLDDLTGTIAEIIKIVNIVPVIHITDNYRYELRFLEVHCKSNMSPKDIELAQRAYWQDNMLTLIERPKEIEIDNMDVFNKCLKSETE